MGGDVGVDAKVLHPYWVGMGSIILKGEYTMMRSVNFAPNYWVLGREVGAFAGIVQQIDEIV